MNKNFLFYTIIGFLIVACSSDDLRGPSEAFQEGEVLSNDEITLRRGGDLNASFMQIKNHPIRIDNLNNTSSASRSGMGNYSEPDLSQAIDLTTLPGVIVPEAGKTYYIPEGAVFSGVLSFMHPATIYVLGTWEGNTFPVSVPAGGKVIVAPSGKMNASHFSMGSIGAVVENFGKTYYSSSTLVGEVYNYNEIYFISPNTQLFPAAIVENHCQMEFNTFTRIENNLVNFGTMDFNDGFIVQSPSGYLVLKENTVVNINSGEGQYNSEIKNEDSSYARINVANGASLKSTHVITGVINGLIDINGNVNEAELNLGNGATVNENAYIPGSSCVMEQGDQNISCDSDLNLILVANLVSPSMQGITLSATDVKVNDDKAYISYHTNDVFYGNSPYGALRIVDLTSVSNPQLTNQAEFNNMEFNGVDVDNNHLYAIGGNKAGGGLVDTPLINGEFTSNLSDFNSSKLHNISGKNTYVHGGSLWLASGSTNGGIYELDIANEFEVKTHTSLDRRTKYIAQNLHSQATMSLDAQGVTVRIANRDGSNGQLYQYTNIKPQIVTGKNVIDMDEDFVYLALSDKGVAKIRLADGELVNTFEPNNYIVNDRKVFNKNGLTNGVAVGDCYLYLANGNDGVIILDKNTFQVVGSFELEQSSNYVYVHNQLLYVATGRDGLNIIQLN